MVLPSYRGKHGRRVGMEKKKKKGAEAFLMAHPIEVGRKERGFIKDKQTESTLSPFYKMGHRRVIDQPDRRGPGADRRLTGPQPEGPWEKPTHTSLRWLRAPFHGMPDQGEKEMNRRSMGGQTLSLIVTRGVYFCFFCL